MRCGECLRFAPDTLRSDQSTVLKIVKNCPSAIVYSQNGFYHDSGLREDNGRYFAEIMYTSREGREQYDYEITANIYSRLGTFADDIENERLIKTGKMTYSFENTMYGTLGPERTVWDKEANEAMKAAEAKQNNGRR